MKDVDKIRCPRCGQPVFPRLHFHQEDVEPYSASTSFSCQNSYRTRHGRRRCGRPTVITHDGNSVVAVFPVAWADIKGMDMEEIVVRLGDRVQRLES